jgi:thiopeptide-type bacteriocin biosynthesis protein
MSADESCLYTLLHAPRENHETLIREVVTPVTRELRSSPEIDCIFFARYSIPDWQLRFRVLGRPSFVAAVVKPWIDAALAPVRAAGLASDVEFASYQREWERYGGEIGMRLAEAIFFRDSLACLDVIDAEAEGRLARTRREFSLHYVERFLDLLEFDRERRVAFYAFGHSWPVKDGTWGEEDLRLLDRRFSELEPGLVELLRTEPDEIAARGLAATRPAVDELLAEHRAGRVRQDLTHLAWSYTHMHCNRLGIEAVPEAILRYFMWRLYTGAHAPV